MHKVERKEKQAREIAIIAVTRARWKGNVNLLKIKPHGLLGRTSS